MAASAVARAVAFVFVLIQSYFKWSPDEELPDPNSNAGFLTSGHHLAGLVLARGGSKGIPKKNMANLYGRPLISWALQAMVDSGVFTTISVSTDDAFTEEWVRKEFKTVRIHSRALYTATDDASSIIAIQEFLSFHPVGLVQATSPLILPNYLRQAATVLRNFDSVFSVYHSTSLRWKAVDKPTKEATMPINFDPKSRPRRQDWSGEMVENGMFYFTMRDLLMHENKIQGTRSAYVEIPKLRSIEIDTPEDLEVAELFMSSQKLMCANSSADDNLDAIMAKSQEKSKDKERNLEPKIEL